MFGRLFTPYSINSIGSLNLIRTLGTNQLTHQIVRRRQQPTLRFYSTQSNKESSDSRTFDQTEAKSRSCLFPLIGLGIGCAATHYYKDEIFGDDDLTGSEIRYLKSIGFKKEYHWGGLYNWRNDKPLHMYNDKMEEYAIKLDSRHKDKFSGEWVFDYSGQTEELCMEAVRFDPTAIAIIKPEFVTEKLLKEMANTIYIEFGDASFLEFAGYDYQCVKKMNFNEFTENYEYHCKRFNVDESTKSEILTLARNIFPEPFSDNEGIIKFEVYMAKNKTLQAFGINYP